MIRRFFIIVWLMVILGGISYIFWTTDLQYQLPTPVPVDYRVVSKGSLINIAGKFRVQSGKPMFIHFFNPDCPCSRFNIDHFKSLVRKYGGKVNFAIVVLNKNGNCSEKEIQDKFDLDLPVSFDRSIADVCGVYSTPQAVLIDNQGRLYYRGNYNKSRYCTDTRTNYAQMAIDTLLRNCPSPELDKSAYISYGCQLPTCKK